MRVELEEYVDNAWVALMREATVEVDEEEEAFLLAALDPGDYDCIERSISHTMSSLYGRIQTDVKIKYRVWRHLERIID